MVQFAALRPKAYRCLIDDGGENEKVKGTKKCVIKCNVKFRDYKNSLEENQLKKETVFDFCTQGMYEETFKRCLYTSTYASNGCKIQQMFEKAVLKDQFMLKYCLDRYKTHAFCKNLVGLYPLILKYVPDLFVEYTQNA